MDPTIIVPSSYLTHPSIPDYVKVLLSLDPVTVSTSTSICERTSVSPASARMALTRLVRDGLASRIGCGRYVQGIYVRKGKAVRTPKNESK